MLPPLQGVCANFTPLSFRYKDSIDQFTHVFVVNVPLLFQTGDHSAFGITGLLVGLH